MENSAIDLQKEGRSATPADVSTTPNPEPQDVSTDVSGENISLTAKKKQLKTKVVERVRKDKDGNIISVCWDVHAGSALVRVYFTPSGERELYTLSYWAESKRVRRVFPSQKLAIEEAKNKGQELARGDLVTVEMSAAEKSACMRAVELLRPWGIPIEIVVADYVEAMKAAKGRKISMRKLMEDYVRRHPIDLEGKRVADVIKECLASKLEDKLSDRYLRQLEYDLNRFAAKFKNVIEEISGRDIDEWLRGLGVSGRTRNNIRMSVQTLFSYAKARRYLPKDHDEMDSVPLAKELNGAIEIFTPAELRELLAAASPELVPFLAIGAFAGVRHAEIQRLDWTEVRFDADIIEIHAGNAKTATRRTVPILPNLKAWLEKHKQESGPVCQFANVTDQIVSLLTKINHKREEAAAGSQNEVKEFKWKHNGLRHSFISYRVAVVKNVAQVALEAGNSPAMIFSNYRELVTPKDAETWFAIMPPESKGKPGKMIRKH